MRMGTATATTCVNSSTPCVYIKIMCQLCKFSMPSCFLHTTSYLAYLRGGKMLHWYSYHFSCIEILREGQTSYHATHICSVNHFQMLYIWARLLPVWFHLVVLVCANQKCFIHIGMFQCFPHACRMAIDYSPTGREFVTGSYDRTVSLHVNLLLWFMLLAVSYESYTMQGKGQGI